VRISTTLVRLLSHITKGDKCILGLIFLSINLRGTLSKSDEILLRSLVTELPCKDDRTSRNVP